MTSPRTIRTLGLAEVKRLVDWAADEGWNPGLADATAFLAADPEGFLGAFVADEMVSGISAVRYGQHFGFIGLYITRPQHRGQGHGKAVWTAAMRQLEGRVVGLDGVPAQQDNYRVMGFATAYETVRLSGRPTGLSAGMATAHLPTWPHLAALDAACFPAPRETFLRNWALPLRHVRSLVDGNGLAGFGAVRACRDGHKVGPLFARSQAAALDVLGALAVDATGAIHIDVPVAQSDFIATLAAAGMVPGFSTARMYRGPAPAIAQQQVFGITSLELG